MQHLRYGSLSKSPLLNFGQIRRLSRALLELSSVHSSSSSVAESDRVKSFPEALSSSAGRLLSFEVLG